MNSMKKAAEKKEENIEYIQIDEKLAYETLQEHTEGIIKQGNLLKTKEGEELGKEGDSFGSISSVDERECELMFSNDFAFRFEAQKKIHSDIIELE